MGPIATAFIGGSLNSKRVDTDADVGLPTASAGYQVGKTVAGSRQTCGDKSRESEKLSFKLIVDV